MMLQCPAITGLLYFVVLHALHVSASATNYLVTYLLIKLTHVQGAVLKRFVNLVIRDAFVENSAADREAK